MSLNFYSKTKLKLTSLKKFFVISFIAVFSFGHSYSQLATALGFDGTSATVNVPASPSVNISSAITIETWVFPTKNSFGVQDVVCKSSATVNNGYIFPRFTRQLGSVQFQLNINGFGWQTLEVSYGAGKLNQWHHLAATYDGLTMSIYIDGVLAGSQNFAGTITVNNNPLTIANQPGLSEFFGGKLDETRIWNKALSQCTIANNMNCELTLPQAGLALYYKYNQGILNGINLGETTVTDASGNGNTGSLSGFLLTGLLSNWAAGTVSSSSCTAIAPISASAAQTLVPVGGDINLSATGGGTYSWVGPNGYTSNAQNPLIHGVSTDYSGTYTVTVTNNGCTSTAKVGVTVAWMAGALNFNSLGSKVVVPNTSSLNPAALTIETWINPSNNLPAVQDVISKSSSNTATNPTPSGYIFPRTEDGWRNFMFRLYINGVAQIVTVPYPASLNQWNHVAATYDGTTMKVYFNGNLAGSLAVTGNITYYNNDLLIGVQDGTSEYYQGSLDETRIWSRALTQCEIQNNITCTLYGGNNALAAQNGLAAYFRYDQGLQNVNNSAYTTLADSSGHGNNGTLQGFLLNGLTSNWVTGNVSATCSPFVGSQAVAGSNGPNIAVGSTLLLTSSAGNGWSWTGPNGFTSTQQNPSIPNVTVNASGTYTVTIAGNGCNSSDKTTVTVAPLAGSLSFDGVKDMVTVPSNATMKGTKEITIESWINPTNSTNSVQDVMSKSTTALANTGFIFPRTNDGWRTLSFYLASGGAYHTMSVPYPGTNQWHHVAATYDGFFMRIYIDGALAGSLEATGDLVVNDVPLTLGVQPGFSEYYGGQIDEARFWTKALSQCEIVNDMSCQVNAVQKPGLAVYFRFNQGFVNANNSTVTTVIDSSGNSNNGTINNFNLTGSTSNWAPPQVTGTCSAYTDPVVTASASASVYAVGSTIQLFGTGGFAGSGGNAYIWDGPNSFNSTTQNPVISNAQTNATGTYTLTAPFVNCVIKKSTRLTVSSLNQITANGPVTFCPSGSVLLSIGTTGNSYQWYRNTVLIPGATASSYTATQSGDYSVSTTTGTDVLMSAPITITVVDNVAPVPNVGSLPTLNLATPATVSTIPNATDNCKGNVVATTTSPLVYNTPGTYNITWTYDDGNGNIITQTQQVVVVLGVDIIPPVLTVPSNIAAAGNTTVCGATASFTATATDNSGLPVTITYSQNPGTVFPVGITTVTVTATDASNNVTTGTFTISVSPTVVAAITGTTSVCAGSTTTLATTSTGGTWSTNNATVATVNTSGVVSGLTAGTAVITYTNNCGATASATVTVKALPATPTVFVADNCGTSSLSTSAVGILLWSTGAATPMITVSTPGTYTLTLSANGCVSAPGSGTAAPKAVPSTPVVTVVNNCGTSTLSTTATGTLAWSVGNATTSSITVSNAGSYSVTQTVNSCPSAAGSGTAAPKATPATPAVTVADNCGTSILSTTATGTLAWSTGATSSSITVSNAGSYSVIQTVNGCPSAAGSGTAAPKATPATPAVTVANNCGSSTLSTNATGSLSWNTGATTASITVSSAGSYNVTQTVNGCPSAAGSATAAPNASPTVSAITGNTSLNIGTTTQLADATTGGVWSSNSTNATVSTSGLVTGVTGGTATISYTITNGTCSTVVTTVVTVSACTTPAFSSSIANISANATSGCSATVTYTATTTGTPAATLSYTFSGATTGSGSGTGSGSAFNKGVTTVILTATNNCGSVSKSFTITVIAPPVPTVAALPTVTGECSAAVNTKPTAKNPCTGAVITGTTPDATYYTAQGTYTIHWTYTDANGNTTTQNQTVVVDDITAPVPTVSTLPTITGQCSASVVTLGNNCNDNCSCCRNGCNCRSNNNCNCRNSDYNYRNYYYGGGWYGNWNDDDDRDDCSGDDDNHNNGSCSPNITTPTAVDNCKGTITGTTTDPLTYSGQGTYTIHWKFDDGNGNVTIQNQTVIVKDNIAPVANSNSLQTVSGNCKVSVTTRPTATDNCAGTITGTTTDALTYTDPGTYTIHWTYNDGNGNTSTQTQTVIVKDVIAPVPVVSNLSTITGSCSVTVTTVPTAKDNCDGTVIATTTDPLTYSKAGTYTIHWSYSDGKNITTQNQTVVIKDASGPSITDPADVTVSCNGSTDPSATGYATATDNCSVVTVTYSDAVNGNVITRTWKATDASGNTATSKQVITTAASFSVSVNSVPTNNTYTGGINTNLYLGYGAQSTTLQLASLPGSGAPYTYSWSGSARSMLNSSTSSAPVFTPTTNGYYTFTVTVTNKYGCTATASVSICVTDVRVPNCNGNYVYLTHTTYNRWGSASSETIQVTINQVSSHIQSNSCGGGGNCRLGSTSQSPCGLTANSIVTAPTTAVTTNSATKEGSTDAATTEEELKITVMPNPSTTYFTLKFESKYETPISMRVMDAGGRVVDAQSKIGSNSTIQIGANYASGTYYAEMIQGTQRKVVQLMKVK